MKDRLHVKFTTSSSMSDVAQLISMIEDIDDIRIESEKGKDVTEKRQKPSDNASRGKMDPRLIYHGNNYKGGIDVIASLKSLDLHIDTLMAQSWRQASPQWKLKRAIINNRHAHGTDTGPLRNAA